jgi:L-ascorbate metabolism protein UlaG (beta-lactamase superfamily)
MTPPSLVRLGLALIVLASFVVWGLASRARAGSPQPEVDPVPTLDGRAAMVAARQRFFGHANVDPTTGSVRRDRVILSWVGVASFAMAIRGQVVLLDAWVPRGRYSGYVPTSPDEIAQLRPKAIFIGHGHFDHATDATPLALATGARLVGTAEQCADLRTRTADRRPRCTAAVPSGAAPGTIAHLRLLRGAGVRVTAVKHLHSAATPPDGRFAPVTLAPTNTTTDYPPTPEDEATFQRHLTDPEGGSMLYRFRVGSFSLVWHDSSGPLADQAPAVLSALRRLRPVTVELGAIVGFGMFNNGFRDPLLYYARTLRPGLFVPTHHDDWFPPALSTHARNLESQFRTQFRQAFPNGGPGLRFLRDRKDYIRPSRLSFDLDS